MPDDYQLWKLWWYAAMYGASAEVRMALLDMHRNIYAPPAQG